MVETCRLLVSGGINLVKILMDGAADVVLRFWRA